MAPNLTPKAAAAYQLPASVVSGAQNTTGVPSDAQLAAQVALPGNIRYDRLRNLYLPSDTALLNLKMAFAKARNGVAPAGQVIPARILTRGDSTTYGTIGGGGTGNPGAVTNPTLISWVDKVRTILNGSLALGGTIGEGTIYDANDPRFTLGAGWSAPGPSASFGAGGTFTFADDSQSNAWDVTAVRSGGGTSRLPVSVDGGATQYVTLPNSSNASGTTRITAAAVGAHTLVFSPPDAAGNTQILNIESINTTAPSLARIQRFGISGQTFANLNPSSTGSGTNMWPLLKAAPDAIFLLMGINDWHNWAAGSGTPAAGAAIYETNLEAFATAFRAINCDPIFIVPPSYNYANQNPGAYEALLWHQAIYTAADAQNVAVLDLQRRWGYGNTSVITGSNALYDGTHPTRAGYYDIAKMVAGFLSTAV